MAVIGQPAFVTRHRAPKSCWCLWDEAQGRHRRPRVAWAGFVGFCR